MHLNIFIYIYIYKRTHFSELYPCIPSKEKEKQFINDETPVIEEIRVQYYFFSFKLLKQTKFLTYYSRI